jgi:ferredoxin
MRGTSWIREQALQDPLLVEALRQRGWDDVPLWKDGKHSGQEDMVERRDAAIRRWNELRPLRDGPVNPKQTPVDDPAAMAEAIKQKCRELCANDAGVDIGITALRPEFIELGVDLPHKNVIAIIIHEDYRHSVEGPLEVEVEAMEVYARCAEVSTEIARHIREDLGYPATAHHNGSFQIQAIPVFYEVGFGELGRHGSLIHKDFGANFRPGMVSTDLPLAYDSPQEFGVQDYCMNCNLCRANCPGDAIPDDYIVTNGVKRWLTDIDKCYPISRFREAYCHICVDVCPYIHKENGDAGKRSLFKDYMRIRKDEGYKSPKGDR